MTGRVRLAVVALLAIVFALVAPSLLHPVDAAPAQTPPLIPTDPLIKALQPVQPVLEIVSPIAWPICADALLVSVLPGAAGVELPPELANVTGPLLVLCGSVPQPGTNTRVCALDTQAQALLAELTKPVLGSGAPVEIAPLKWLTGEIDTLVDLLPIPGVPKGSIVAATLQCVDPGPETTTTTPSGGTTVPTTTGVIELPTASVVDPPTFAELQTLPPLDTAEIAAPTAPAAPAVTPVVRLIDQPRFRYPAVMGLPLLLLALLVFFGRALTRPLYPSREEDAP